LVYFGGRFLELNIRCFFGIHDYEVIRGPYNWADNWDGICLRCGKLYTKLSDWEKKHRNRLLNEKERKTTAKKLFKKRILGK
jgi:hypothetical protein